MKKNLLEEAITLLQQCSIAKGILASLDGKDDVYHRIWTRDAIVSGLSGLVVQDKKIIKGLLHTLKTLKGNLGAQGEVPSNIALTKSLKVKKISYGTPVGRVDATLWYLIGWLYLTKTNCLTTKEKKDILSSLEKIFTLLNTWHFSSKELIYTPTAGFWADEMPIGGYVLYNELLYLWSLKLFYTVTRDKFFKDKASRLNNEILLNFYPTKASLKSVNKEKIVHPTAVSVLHSKTKSKIPYFLTSLDSTGYLKIYDFWSNALAVLLLNDSKKTSASFNWGQRLIKRKKLPLVPSFWPPIKQSNRLYPLLQTCFKRHFRNYPGSYQNAGLWPVITGWWCLALEKLGDKKELNKLKENLENFCKKRSKRSPAPSFREWAHLKNGRQDGAFYCSWTAASVIYSTLSEKALTQLGFTTFLKE